MSGRWLLALALAAVLLSGAVYVFSLEFAGGEVYPEYSSLRTDPKGARLLYDSLSSLPGVTVERNYRALEFLPDSGVTVLLLAIPVETFGADPEPYLRNMEAAARRGNRMVAALTFRADSKSAKFDELRKKWGVQISVDGKAHQNAVWFSDSPGWTEERRAGSKLLTIERAFGKGSIVLMANSDDFTNQSTVAANRLGVVTLAIGANPRIIFDEQHLGIVDSGSVVALARRFHLTGLAIGLALCAALLLWRNGVDFPPPAHTRVANRLAGRTAQAGLITLLRRHIPLNSLAATCWQEWLNGNRGKVSQGRLARAATIARQGADHPLEALREMQAVLHAKGEL